MCTFDERLEAALERAARQHDTVCTPSALEADIRADAYYLPLIATTRMWLAETHNIPYIHLDRHCAPLLCAVC